METINYKIELFEGPLDLLLTLVEKNKMKIEEHRAMWEEEDRKEREYRADAEMEDFTGRMQVGDDDDTFD